jgi:hypothetical protein
VIQTGQCSCGAIRYRFDGEPLFTHAWHCTECQRRSGAAFCLSTFVEARRLSITARELPLAKQQRNNETNLLLRWLRDDDLWLRTAQSYAVLVAPEGLARHQLVVRASPHLDEE